MLQTFMKIQMSKRDVNMLSDILRQLGLIGPNQSITHLRPPPPSIRAPRLPRQGGHARNSSSLVHPPEPTTDKDGGLGNNSGNDEEMESDNEEENPSYAILPSDGGNSEKVMSPQKNPLR